MPSMNNAAERVRRELLIRVIRGELDGTLDQEIDRIPIVMRPSDQPASRCCVYKDRAVLKYRLMGILGFGVEDETDEAKPLREYLAEARLRREPPREVLSVAPVACYGCIESHYVITNACRACFARPCTFSCPKQAITVGPKQAEIDHSKCIDCGKCTTVCPYKAIIRVPIPCEEACPTGAIRKDESGREWINFDTCISCGKCLKACPFSAVLERSQIIEVIRAMKEGRRVVAMVAPAIIGQFPATLEQLAEGLRMAGFSDMLEVASGAELTARNEAKEFFERMERGDHLMTSSCCPAYVEAVRKLIPEMKKFVSDTPSPMGYSGRLAKEQDPECVTVFIGPCVAKRKEACSDPNVDYVMTFEELGALFAAREINLGTLEGLKLKREADPYARGFGAGCGVTAAILHEMSGGEGQTPPRIDGKLINPLDRKNMRLLKLHALGKLPGNFLEVMACEGGCVGGPCALVDAEKGGAAVRKLAHEE